MTTDPSVNLISHSTFRLLLRGQVDGVSKPGPPRLRRSAPQTGRVASGVEDELLRRALPLDRLAVALLLELRDRRVVADPGALRRRVLEKPLLQVGQFRSWQRE